MKKSIFIFELCLILGAVLIAGCLGGDNSNVNNSSNNSTNNTTPSAPPTPLDPPTDAALFRGTVETVSVENETAVILLTIVPGTNYGSKHSSFSFTNETHANFNFSDLKFGDHLEVYYTAYPGNPRPKEAPIIVANLLADADLCIFNGAVTKITPNDGDSGKIEMELMNNTTMIFNYDSKTQFYMNQSDIKEGTKLNIYGNWIIQTSMPSQTTAYEIREYYER